MALMRVTIPQDITASIIDTLAADDGPTLPSLHMCALACRAFLPLSRKHIFQTVKVNDIYVRERSPTARMFANLLSETPEIGDYIRTLDYCILKSDFQIPSLPSALKSITNLQHLNVWYYHDSRSPFNPSTFNPYDMQLNWKEMPLHSEFQHLLSLPTLSRFYVHNGVYNFPLSDFGLCSNLKVLAIRKTEIGEIDIENWPSTSKSIHLDEFSFGIGAADTTKQLVSAKFPNELPIFNFTTLKKLSADLDSPKHVDAAKEVCKLAENLVCLHFTASDRDLTLDGLYESIGPSAKTLKDLKLHVHKQRDREDPLGGLCHELERLKGGNVVEVIDIHIHLPYEEEPSAGEEWGQIDEVFSRGGWPSLREVRLKFYVTRIGAPPGPSGEFDDAMKSIASLRFSKLSSSKAVTFNLTYRN